ncbi:glucosaminidase domain-containing protein [Litoribaculum gwangyangense]|uniref:Peptidoglycan hydrolase n=2 Tax=Litoribaculum gwangyangense TaxID=1130722 RepID=A0ABP9CLC0_9FLAO
MLFSCKAKRSVVTKKRTIENKEEVVIHEENLENTTSKPEKTYANDTEKYIDIYKEIAQIEMRLYNIPASITLAQGILESASGNGRLSVEANNHFGIKCHEWTGAKIYHDDDAAQECFRKYNDPKYSFRDHSLFLTERKRYSNLFSLKKEDYKGWAKGLKAAGYATDRKYPEKLISLIERYNLHELDKEVLGDAYVKHETPDEETVISYTVSKGDTLYSISKRYNITVKELQNLNGLNDTALSIGQVLVVKPSEN